MKLLGLLLVLGVVPIVHLACAQATGGGERLRGLQSNVVVDLMVLYSDKSWPEHDHEYEGFTYTQNFILTQLEETNEAMARSGIELTIDLVHMGPLPYVQTTTSHTQEIATLAASPAVRNLRNRHRADLVMMTGHFTFCGYARVFNGNQLNGFSVVAPRASCASLRVVAHELGHSLGCTHNTDSTDPDNGYNHGFQYCGGESPYRTIMALGGVDCGHSPITLQYSNPNVKFESKPTGDADYADCARTIRENMVEVSEFRKCFELGTPCTASFECCAKICNDGRCRSSW